MPFIPTDEYLEGLLQHSDVEDEGSDDLSLDMDFDFSQEFESEDESPQEYKEKWERKRFPAKTILDKMPIPIAKAKTPMEYFSKYFPDELFEKMAKFTQKSLKARRKKDKYCTTSLIKTFFGVNALMGVMKCPNRKVYFSPNFQYGPISKRITQEKFKQIMLSLHVVDADNPDHLEKLTNRLWKVQPVIDSVRFRCLQLTRDSSHYSIGEQMIHFFTPRLATSFNFSSKPVGLKNFIVTDSNGLIVDFEIYQGSLTDLPDRNFGTCAALVLRLARSVQDSCLYFGRHFTSVALMNELAKRDVKATGMIWPCRFRKDIYQFKRDKDMKTQEYEEVSRPDGKVCAIKWMDRRGVIVMSTVFGCKPKKRCDKFDEQTQKYAPIPHPLALANYKRHILGLSLNQKLLDLFSPPFKSKKWPVNVILYLFEISIINSYFEYRAEAKRSNYTRVETLEAVPFRLQIIENLLGEVNLKRKLDEEDEEQRGPSPTLVPEYFPPALESLKDRFDGKDHWLIVDKSIKSQRICRREKCKSRTNNMCSKCKIYLCYNHHKNCFYTFHNKMDKKPD